MTVDSSFGPEDLVKAASVSRETLARLQTYADLLIAWQRALNLVSASTLGDLWRRHMLDSVQLAPMIGPAQKVADLGSGAGFPGMVLAILAQEHRYGPVVLVESDQRKCGFLREVRRATGVEVEIRPERIETAPPLGADVVTARALAPVSRLLELAQTHLVDGGRCLFLKGRQAEEELTQAQKYWKMSVARHPSQSDPQGAILEIGDIRHV